jgi:hypothetical protein
MKKIYLIITGIICFAFHAASQNVGINRDGAAPHPSAMLDIQSASGGVLIPRIALTGNSDTVTIVKPAPSLLVYNTAAAGSGNSAITPGYYFWNGSAWVRLMETGTNLPNLWKKDGNAGTSPGTDFIGTTDAKSLMFKVNNQKAGHIDITAANTFFGYRAGLNTTTGFGNIGISYNALGSNVTGYDNIAIGEGTLFAAANSVNNIAIGKFALVNDTTGASNTAVGNQALYYNRSGSSNSVFGYQSMANNTTGYQNNAFGEFSLAFNTTGFFNVAMGKNALYYTTTGSENTAIGHSAVSYPGTLTNSTAVGARSVVACSNCMVLGSVAGNNGATTDVNVGIGTTGPAQPLSFRSSLGGKISFYESGNGSRYGIGIQGSLMQFYTDHEGGDMAFGWGSSENFTEAVRIKANKRIGIGTNDPQASLDVYHTTGTTVNIRGTVNISHFCFGTEEHTYIRGGKAGSNVLINDYAGSGNVGIGTSAPSTFYKLDVSGNIRCSSLFQTSDERLKTNIQPMDNITGKLNQLHAYTYQWKDTARREGTQYGMLAQEVEKIFPELVKTDEQGMKAVNYSGLIPVLLQAVKEQHEEIEKLKAALK